MRILHLADLHLGRSLSEFSLIDLQKEFLTQIIHTVSEKNIDAVLIAGDVYDRTMPSIHAVQLLNGFLSALSRMKVPVLLIAGNHDSAERLSFLSGVLGMQGIHIAGEYAMGAHPVTLCDEFGPVHFHLLPFFRPGVVRSQLPEARIETYDDAVRAAVGHMNVNTSERNVLLAHHFVCSAGQMPMQSDSEMPFLGGLELVHASNFDDFDYVALGHLHHPQKIGRETVRYAGSPIQYSLGEADSRKSFVIAELNEKGKISVEPVPIRLSVGLRSVRGRLSEIMNLPNSENDGDFLAVQLTDENPVYDAMQTLRTRYPRVVSVRRERDMVASAPGVLPVASVRDTDPLSLFDRFCEEVTGYPLTDAERSDIESILTEAHEEDNA